MSHRTRGGAGEQGRGWSGEAMRAPGRVFGSSEEGGSGEQGLATAQPPPPPPPCLAPSVPRPFAWHDTARHGTARHGCRCSRQGPAAQRDAGEGSAKKMERNQAEQGKNSRRARTVPVDEHGEHAGRQRPPASHLLPAPEGINTRCRRHRAPLLLPALAGGGGRAAVPDAVLSLWHPGKAGSSRG